MKKIWEAIRDFVRYDIDFGAIGVGFLTLAIIVGLAFAVVVPMHNIDVMEYNDGNCSCGGHYEYSQAIGHRMSTTYIYTCDKCGKPIEIDYIP